MDKKLERILDDNQNLTDDFKKITHESFDKIFAMLKTKNFIRWLNMKPLDDRLKKLIVEEFLPEDYKKHPTWGRLLYLWH